MFADKRKPDVKWEHGDPCAVQLGGGVVPRSGSVAALTQVCCLYSCTVHMMHRYDILFNLRKDRWIV